MPKRPILRCPFFILLPPLVFLFSCPSSSLPTLLSDSNGWLTVFSVLTKFQDFTKFLNLKQILDFGQNCRIFTKFDYFEQMQKNSTIQTLIRAVSDILQCFCLLIADFLCFFLLHFLDFSFHCVLCLILQPAAFGWV